MRCVVILLLSLSCAGQSAERPNSANAELQRMRDDRLGSDSLASSRARAAQEDFEVDRREKANRERAEARAQKCESECDASRAACEAQCAEEPRCLARCPQALSCRAGCR